MKSLRLKVIMLMLLSGISVLLIVISISLFSIYRNSSQLLNQTKEVIFSDYDKNVRNQVENAVSLIKAVHKYQEENRLTDEQGKSLARELVRGLKYDKNGYFWIDDFEGINICNPPDPSTEEKSRIALKDVNGKEIIKEIIANGKLAEGGYTDYWYPKPGEKEANRKRSYSKSYDAYRWVIGTGNYVDDMEKVVAAQERENADYIRNLIFLILGAGAALSLIIIIVSVKFGNSLSRPIVESAKAAIKLSEGDLTVRIDKKFSGRKDEVGTLVSSINSANENLERMITTLVSAMQNLYYATEQINKGNQDLSQRTTEQASSLEEIASTIEETTAAINQNSDNARNANETSKASSIFAEKGGDLVAEAVSSINEISHSSKKIGEIISVINEIAFQTNLLALNAAVEAARAGEQGRGVAVVAGEGRNLAQRAGSAAKEIGDLIKDSIEKIEKGNIQANNSGEAIREIISSVKNVTQLISEIAAASDEQKSGINQINIAVTELDNMTQQNAALVEETASASEEMASQALDLMEMTKMFKFNADMEAERDKYLKIKSTAGFEEKTGTPEKAVKKEVKKNGTAPKARPVTAKKPEAKPGPGEDNDVF